MTAGRPNLPAEVKAARGTLNTTRENERASIEVKLGPLDITPPSTLGERGLAVWDRITSVNARWLTAADYEALALTAKLADLAELAEAAFRRTEDPKEARALLGFLDAFAASLGRLGFDPASRSKLGIREIDARSKLQKMMARDRNQAQGQQGN